MAEGVADLGKDYGCDCLYYRNLRLESGRIYGLISEYGQGCMYLSWLLGGKTDTDKLRIFWNDKKMCRKDLEKISWNLEPSGERYRNAVVIKAIQKAIRKNGLPDRFSDIQTRFFSVASQTGQETFTLKRGEMEGQCRPGICGREKNFLRSI